MVRRCSLVLLTAALAFTSSSFPSADGSWQTLPFTQNWSGTGLISISDDWSAVPGVNGYRGDALTGGTGVDPQTVVTEGAAVLDVNANQTNPNTFTTGGVAEFDTLVDPVVALQGSGTARAPNLVFNVDTTGLGDITVAYNLRDVDGSLDNSVQPVALQFRIGSSGNFTNVPSGFVPDASSGPSLATQVTPVSAILPAAANNQAQLQIRVITTDALGSDEWIGVDDVSITGTVLPSTPPSGLGAANPSPVPAGNTTLLTVATTPGTNPVSTGIGVIADLTDIGGSATQVLNDTGTSGDVTAGDGTFSFLATVAMATAPGAKSLPFTVSDAQVRSSTGNIALTVDPPPPPPPPPGESLPFHQDWTDTSLITVDDNWSGVTGIVGYRGDDLTTTTGTNAQTVLADGNLTPIDVIANQLNPDTLSTGGVAEFHLANPTVALNGSGTADAPFLQIAVTTVGVTNVRVSYNVRDLDGSADNAVQQVALQYRLSNTGAFTNVPAAYIADATSANAATLVIPVSVVLPANAGNQSRVEIRILTTNAVGNDEWVGIDDIAVVDADAPVPPTGSGAANPPSVQPGNVTLLTVAVTPGSNPVSTGLAVTVDTAPIGFPGLQPMSDNGTDGDVTAGDRIFSFEAVVASGQLPGPRSLPFTVSDAQFRSSTGSIALTVLPPPPPLALIHDVQGSGSTSPMVGLQVFVEGIVTARVSNGFFMQEEVGDYDSDANTSEGILVFTAGTPPPSAAVGNLVSVLGTVTEFIPAGDPNSPPKTELGFATVTELDTAQPLPPPITLTAVDTDPLGGLDVLERFEGMRVHVESLTVIAPTSGNVNEANATATSNGVFYGVITGVPRPFREPGIQILDPVPPPNPPNVPRFDRNPERLRVDSDAQPGAARLEVAGNDLVTGMIGPLDYSFFTYTILPDPATAVVTPVMAVTPVAVPGAGQFTVASSNMQRLFDSVPDAGTDDPVVNATAFANRLNKGSLLVRNVLRMPDILGVEEVEHLSVLQALAEKINADAVAASQPDPQYVAYLEEGNDIGGIDSGFLVKSSRVTGVAVVQEGLTTTYTDPNNNLQALLNDRPPLILTGTVHGGDNQSADVTVIVNHLRSLSGVDDPADGNRIRTKRRAQAEFLANLVQDRQTLHPDERIILVGDFNAFQFNDGLGDSIGTIKGTPTPADQVVLHSDDLVNPDLVNLVETELVEERYSFMFDGNAQTLDHVLVNPPAYALFEHFDHARVNADFPETARNDSTTPARFADHDPVVAFFDLPANPTSTDLVSSLNPSIFGQPVTFTATVTVSGSPASGTVEFHDGAALLASVPLDSAGQAQATTNALTVGPHAISAQFLGTAALLSSSASLTQTVVADTQPIITAFAPDHGPVGTPVLILGERFNGVTAVTFNGTPTLFVRLTSHLILTIVPTGATSGPIAVTAEGGTGTSATPFTVTTPPPNILFFTPDSGRVGQQVLIAGTNFTGATSVKFGVKPASFTVIGPNLISATVPSGAVTAPITVTTPAGSDTSTQSFKVKH